MRSRWIPLTLLLAGTAGLLAAIISISVGEHKVENFRIEGEGDVQELIAGIPQLDNRLGPDDAPVTLDLFTDIQSPRGADYQATVVDPLIEDYVRTGDVQINLRHFPLGPKSVTLGGIAAEAAGFQGKQWQFAELFMRNLSLAPEQGVTMDFLDEVGGFVPKLDVTKWEQDLDSPEAEQLAAADEDQAAAQRFSADPAIVVTGPSASQQLEGAPSLTDVEAAIAAAAG